MLSKGQPFPDFKLKNHQGAFVTRADLKGHWSAVYFYMKDYSDLCTALAREFSMLHRKFKAKGCEIWGVSADSVRSHANMVSRHHLNLSLISDPDHALMEACGVWGPKRIHGKEAMGAYRSAFIIDPEGLVREATRDVIRAKHPAQVFELLAAAQKELGGAS